MKMAISWHKNCAKNFQESVEREERELACRQARVERMRLEVEFYKRQIAAAELRRMDGFDRDRLLVQRGAFK